MERGRERGRKLVGVSGIEGMEENTRISLKKSRGKSRGWVKNKF